MRLVSRRSPSRTAARRAPTPTLPSAGASRPSGRAPPVPRARASASSTARRGIVPSSARSAAASWPSIVVASADRTMPRSAGSAIAATTRISSSHSRVASTLSREISMAPRPAAARPCLTSVPCRCEPTSTATSPGERGLASEARLAAAEQARSLGDHGAHGAPDAPRASARRSAGRRRPASSATVSAARRSGAGRTYAARGRPRGSARSRSRHQEGVRGRTAR